MLPTALSLARRAAVVLPASLLALGALAVRARADVFDAARVPADARWFAHVDVEALKRSELFAALQSAHVDDFAGLDGLSEFGELGIDPLRDLRSIAVYCQDKNPEHAVLLVVGNAQVDEALSKLSSEPSYRAAELDGRRMHVWGEGAQSSYVCVARREGSEDRLVVRAPDEASLRRALAVIDGRTPSLASAASSAGDKNVDQPRVRLVPSKGSILYAAALGGLSELTEVDMASNVTRLCKQMLLDVGESQGEVHALLEMETRTDAEARQLQQVMQGGLALLALAQGSAEDPDLAKPLQDLTNAFRFTAQGSSVQCEFRMAVSLLLEDLRRWQTSEADDDDDAPEQGNGK